MSELDKLNTLLEKAIDFMESFMQQNPPATHMSQLKRETATHRYAKAEKPSDTYGQAGPETVNAEGDKMNENVSLKGDGGLKFRAEDFMIMDVSADGIAFQANQKFQRWLSAQPVVYGDANRDKGNGDNCVGWTQTPCAALDTHTARLVDITPLQADSAEAIVRELADCAVIPTGGYVGKLIERARKLTRKEDL